MNATNELLKEAERAAGESETWADLSNFLFDPVDGLVAKAYPTRAAREAFVRTDEYRKIRQLVSEAMQRHGLVEGATPKKTDRLVVQLPQSLRAALELEAEKEGVSLDQLVLAKLAVGLGRLTNLVLQTEGEGHRQAVVVSTQAWPDAAVDSLRFPLGRGKHSRRQ